MTFPPNISALHGIVYAVASRIYNEEEIGDVLTVEQLEAVKNNIKEYRDFIKDIELDKPSSLMKPLLDYLDTKISERRNVEEVENFHSLALNWFDDNTDGDWRSIPEVIENTIVSTVRRLESMEWDGHTLEHRPDFQKEIVKDVQRDERTLVRMHDSKDERMEIYFSVVHKEAASREQKTSLINSENIYIKSGNNRDSFADYLWEANGGSLHAHAVDHVEPKADGSSTDQELHMFPLQIGDTEDVVEYKGPLQGERERIRKMEEHGESPTVMLYGKPGVGKSVFCNDLAKKMDHRTIKFSIYAIKDSSYRQIRNIRNTLSPDLVIIDDFDSIWEGQENEDKGPLKNLSTLNRDQYDVTVLLSANDVEILPDAIKRPGRIDRIVNAECQNREERAVVQDHLSDVMDVEIPESYEQKVDDFHKRYSAAHLKDLFKQVKIFGWGEDIRWEYPYQEYESTS